jgi:transcriptional regulator with XRE-family HTH domain
VAPLAGMGRHRTDVSYLAGSGPEWALRYRCEWGMVVGARVKRLRLDRGLTLRALTNEILRPDSGRYSPGFFSRLERGWASPPLWVYVVLAERFEVAGGRLLGVEGFEQAVSEGELTLVRLVRRLGIEPDEAIARIVRA